MRPIEIDELEAPVFFGIGATDRDRDSLAVGRPACGGRSVPGRKNAKAIVLGEIHDPDTLPVRQLRRAVAVEQALAVG